MIQVDDKNKCTITLECPNDIEREAARISVLLVELTRKLNDKDPEYAIAFLRVVHTMVNGLAKPIVDKMDNEADKSLKNKMNEKRKAREAKRNGNKEQSDTTSGNAAESGEFDSIGSDKSATGYGSNGPDEA